MAMAKWWEKWFTGCMRSVACSICIYVWRLQPTLRKRQRVECTRVHTFVLFIFFGVFLNQNLLCVRSKQNSSDYVQN